MDRSEVHQFLRIKAVLSMYARDRFPDTKKTVFSPGQCWGVIATERRRNRRLIIAGLLILEAGFLFAGIFILSFSDPLKALTFWISPLLLIIWLVYLGLNDFRETSRDIDMIIRETSDVILKKQN